MLGSLHKLPLILKQCNTTKHSILRGGDAMSILQMRKLGLRVSLVSWSRVQYSNPSLPEALISPWCQASPLPAKVVASVVLWLCVILLELKWPITVFIEYMLNVEYYRKTKEGCGLGSGWDARGVNHLRNDLKHCVIAWSSMFLLGSVAGSPQGRPYQGLQVLGELPQ